MVCSADRQPSARQGSDRGGSARKRVVQGRLGGQRLLAGSVGLWKGVHRQSVPLMLTNSLPFILRPVLLMQWRRRFAFSVCKAAGRMGKTTLKIAHRHCLHLPPFPPYDLFRRCHGAAASHSVFTWQQAGWRDLQPEDPPAAPSDARSGGGWEMKCGRCEMCGPKVACKVGRVANFLPGRRNSDAAPHKRMLPRS